MEIQLKEHTIYTKYFDQVKIGGMCSEQRSLKPHSCTEIHAGRQEKQLMTNKPDQSLNN